MGEPSRGAVRGLRTLLATLLLVGLGAAAHAVGGGHVPSPLVLAFLGLLLAPGTWWATRRRLGVLSASALLGAGQVLVHGALTSMAPTLGTAPPPPGHHLASLSGMAAHPLAHDLAHTAGLSAPMLLAHLGATLLTALLLARGEDLLWRVVARLVPPLRRPPVLRGRGLCPLWVIVTHLATRATPPHPARGPPRVAT